MSAKAGLTLHRDISETMAFPSFAPQAQLAEASRVCLTSLQGAAATAVISALQITQPENWICEA